MAYQAGGSRIVDNSGNINAGVTTATLFVGDGSGLTNIPGGAISGGVVTQLVAGSNITISPGSGQGVVTVNSLGGGGGSGGLTGLQEIDDISAGFNGSQTIFTITVSGSQPIPAGTSVGQLVIAVGGILQTPGDAFTFNSATSEITFTSAPPAGVSFAGFVGGSASSFTPSNTGFGLAISGSAAKVSITQQTNVPIVGSGVSEAIPGSLYWDNTLGVPFIYYNDGDTAQWVQMAGISTASGGGGVTDVTGTAPIVSSGGATPDISLQTSGVAAGSYTLSNITVDTFGRITSASSGSSTIPSGSIMSFFQASAPTGWTQVVSQNNKAIRIVSGSGGGTGGTLGFSSLFSSSSAYSGTINITSGSVGSSSLSEAQLASHGHGFNGVLPSGPAQTTQGYTYNSVEPSTPTSGGVSAAGGNAGHSHSLAGATASGNFTSNFDLQYIDMILASKN